MILVRSTLLLLVLLFPISVFGQNFGQLSGEIVDDNTGQGIENVLVRIGTLEAFTHPDGTYHVTGIPAGRYRVFIERSGYAGLEVQDVMMGSAYHSIVDARLKGVGEKYGVDDEIVVQYRNIGSFTAYNADDIRQLPVRNLTEIVRTAPGVVAFDGFDDLYVRGGRASELIYFIDGVKVLGLTGLSLPQTAIEQISFEANPLSGQYGDALAGIVHITTKSGMQKLNGSFEAFTSETLDPFGHTFYSGTVGGPLIKDKIGISISGEYTDQLDRDPRSLGELYVSDELLDNLRAFPTALRGQLPDGTQQLLPIPGTLADGAQLIVDENGMPVVTNNALSFSDGTTVNLQGVDVATLALNPVSRASFVEDFETRDVKRANQLEHLSLLGAVTITPLPGSRLRLGGRLNQAEQDHRGENFNRHVIFAPEVARQRDTESYDVFASLTQRFGATGYVHLYGSYSDIEQEIYDPRFGTGWDNLLEYGNIENDVFSTLRGYNVVTRLDPPTYEAVYGDGNSPGTEDVQGLVQLPGGGFNTYSQSRSEQFRFSGHLSTTIGRHFLSIGAEYETQTHRYWELEAFRLARYVEDGDVEIMLRDFDRGIESYDEFPLNVFDDFIVDRFGYDLLGLQEVNSENLDSLFSQDPGKPLESYNIAPYEPIFYGGFIEDTFTLSDLQIHAGLRVDVFDNNTQVLIDPFETRPICRVADIETEALCVSAPVVVPPSIGDDFAVYYSGNTIIGYRDTEGIYYNSEGQTVSAAEILLGGQIRVTSALPNSDLFKPYGRRVTLQPRIGARFDVNDQLSLLARFGVTTQRPFFGNVVTLGNYRQDRVAGRNSDPLTRTFVEIGGQYQQQGVGRISLIGFTNNVDDGASINAKGLELRFTSERNKGILLHLDYTLSYAEGTYLGDGGFFVLEGNTPDLDAPVDFDQRHTLNLLMDYKLGDGEGPELGGIHPFENLGINVLLRAGSGFPYTPVIEPVNGALPRRPVARAGINSTRMPSSLRVDLRVERSFHFTPSGASASAFIWVQNLLDRTNVNNVWQFTGDHEIDGFLSTPAGQEFVQNRQPNGEALYRHRTRITDWVGIPRLIRVGVRVDF